MNHVVSGPYVILGLVFLADVASPMSGCGCETDSPDPPKLGAIMLSVSDCSCAPDPITVDIDETPRATLNCGAKTPFTIQVAPGRSYEVSATSSNRTWSARTVEVPDLVPVKVELGCPR